MAITIPGLTSFSNDENYVIFLFSERPIAVARISIQSNSINFCLSLFPMDSTFEKTIFNTSLIRYSKMENFSENKIIAYFENEVRAGVLQSGC